MIRPLKACVFLGPLAVLFGMMRLVFYHPRNRCYGYKI